MLHEPATQDSGPDLAASYKSSLGIKMFIVYAIVYIGFVAIPLYDSTLMDKQIILGINLAVTYGIGLIILALVMAVIYNSMCSSKELEVSANAKTGDK